MDPFWMTKMIETYATGRDFLDMDKESSLRDQGQNFAIELNDDVSPENVQKGVCFDFVTNLKLQEQPRALRERLVSRLFLWAAFRGHEAIIDLIQDQWLLPLAAKDVLGNTALHLSAYLNYPKITEQLLRAGADKEAVNKDGQTPLLMGAKGGLVDSVQLLINAGSKLDVKDREHRTPLLLAVGANSVDVVKALLKQGINCLAHDIRGFTALHFAAQNGNEEIIKILLQTQIEVEVKDQKGCTALHYAAKYGHSSAVQLLLQAGAEKLVKNKKGETAADLSSSYFVKQLLNK